MINKKYELLMYTLFSAGSKCSMLIMEACILSVNPKWQIVVIKSFMACSSVQLLLLGYSTVHGPNGGSLATIQQKTCEEFADKLCLHSIDNRLLHSAVQVCPIMTISLCI